MANFYTILTAIGKAKIANGTVLGTKVNFAKLKVGDGNGAYYEPTESQTELKNVVWEGIVNNITTGGEANPNWIITQTVIPPTDGGFTVREAGIFDSENNLLAISKYPESYKPKMEDGSTSDLTIELIFEVSNASSVTLKIDPLVTTASKKDVQDLEKKIQTEINNLSNETDTHLSDNKGHVPYEVATGVANTYAVTLNPSLTAYEDGMALCVKINVASTGASTLNVNGLGAKLILDSFGNSITSGGLKAGLPYTMRYNGTNFIVQGKGGGGNATAGQIIKDATATADSGTIVGTMPNNGVLNKSLPINGSYTIPAGYTSGGAVTQTIPTKTGATISPSTSQQVITAGQYLSGDQIISAIIGTATDADVVAGKTYNSASGILRTGTASITSLGGVRYATGVIGAQSTTVYLGYQPIFVAVMGTYGVGHGIAVYSAYFGINGMWTLSGSPAGFVNVAQIVISSTGFTSNMYLGGGTANFVAFG